MSGKAMRRSLYQRQLSHSLFALAAATIAILAVFLAFVVLFPGADLNHVTLALPIAAFCFLIALTLELGSTNSSKAAIPSDPLIIAQSPRAPPA